MKLTVIGGGGVRSMFLAKSIAQQAVTLHIDHLVFMDIDEEKLRIYGGMARHVARMLAPNLKFELTMDAKAAVTDADYVITTIRVGGDHMRVRDERIALSKGVLGQETTGAAGLSFAMRSVPALVGYCELIRQYAKKTVKVFNFTNPAGVVSQTLRDMGYDFTYGICDAPSGMLRQFAALRGVEPDEIRGECYGLNHLSFFRSVTAHGQELLPGLLRDPAVYSDTDMRFFEPELAQELNCGLNEYLYYFYYREKAVANILNSAQTRGEVIEEINRAMTRELSAMNIEHDFDTCLACYEKWYGKRENAYMANETGIRRSTEWKFDVYSPDAGGYAGVALRFMQIMQSGRPDSMILCVPNCGAIPGLRADDIVEITCDISAEGVTPHPISDADPRTLELIYRVKAYERLASRAIREKSRQAAIDCLTLHPLVNSWSLGRSLADAYVALNREYCGDWRA